MPVKIELLNRYQLRLKDDDLLLLPVIEIKPTDNFNLPHISRIDISVTGTPEDLALQIQSAYKSVNFSTSKLLKLTTPQRLKQIDCRWDRPLSMRVNCILLVTVEYFDSDEVGNPKLFATQIAVSECNIWTSAPVEETETKVSSALITPPPPGPFLNQNQYQKCKSQKFPIQVGLP